MTEAEQKDDKNENPRFLEFYNVDASIVSEHPRKLLREYSKVPDEEVNSWIEQIVSPINPSSN
jgi:hypothetical protein